MSQGEEQAVALDAPARPSERSKPINANHRQTIAYEVARDVLNSRQAALISQIADEEAKQSTDVTLIAKLEQQIIEVEDEIEKLDVEDESSIHAGMALGR